MRGAASARSRPMSIATETAARVDVLAAAVRAIALALPDDAPRSVVERLQVELAALRPVSGAADAAAAGTLATVLRALARS